MRDPVTFINQSGNASSYLWDFGNKDTSRKVSPVYNYYETGTYNVKLIAYGLDHCPNDTTSEIVNVIYFWVDIFVPNAFTPNGDATNNIFDISSVGIKNYTYDIYNRWGEHIFHAFPGHTGWDGTFKGQDTPEGVYIYQVDAIDLKGKHHYERGNLMLMR